MQQELREITEIQNEIRRCDWNLDRSNFPDRTFNDYRGDWAAHHAYFANYRSHLRDMLRHHPGLSLAGAVENQGIGL